MSVRTSRAASFWGLDYPVGERRAAAATVAQRRAEGLAELGTVSVLAVLPPHPQCPGAEVELYLSADDVVEVEHRQLRRDHALSPQPSASVRGVLRSTIRVVLSMSAVRASVKVRLSLSVSVALLGGCCG
jgi:hypothetical protein